MKRGFYTIMAAQFTSSLADNALLIAAIAMLIEMLAPAWNTPLLKLFFTVSYVMRAPFVGALADSMPKGRVMIIANFIKIGGCLMMFSTLHPLLAYAVVGFGAAAYSPAKYGILTELLPPEKLVKANGWIEGTTVGSIILGALVGGALISPAVADFLLAFDFPVIDTGIDSPAEAALVVIAVLYLVAAVINLWVPDTGARYPRQLRHPIKLIRAFARSNVILWQDKLGQISLAITTLFWGAGATLQFIVLDWARESLSMPLSEAALLQGIVAVGVAGGAIAAAQLIGLSQSLRVLPYGVALGMLIPAMTLVDSVAIAYPLLIVVGALSGYFVVPMNALLQHRGYVRLSAGHSIAVQNFNENLNILFMLGAYALLLRYGVSINLVTILFGGSIAVLTLLVIQWHKYNQRHFDSEAAIGEHRAESTVGH